MASVVVLNEFKHSFLEFYKVSRGVRTLVVFSHTYTGAAHTQTRVYKSKHVGLGAVKTGSLSFCLFIIPYRVVTHLNTFVLHPLSIFPFFARSLPSASFSLVRPWKSRNWMQSEDSGGEKKHKVHSSRLFMNCPACFCVSCEITACTFLKLVQIFQRTFSCVCEKLFFHNGCPALFDLYNEFGECSVSLEVRRILQSLKTRAVSWFHAQSEQVLLQPSNPRNDAHTGRVHTSWFTSRAKVQHRCGE